MTELAGLAALSSSLQYSKGALLYRDKPCMRALCEADSPDNECPGCFASLRSEQEGCTLLRLRLSPAHFVGGAICLRKLLRPQSFEYVTMTVYRFSVGGLFVFTRQIFKEVMHHAKTENHPGAGS